jgi:ABC-type glycerol-3-phosphate transport system substrate-binding protein
MSKRTFAWLLLLALALPIALGACAQPTEEAPPPEPTKVEAPPPEPTEPAPTQVPEPVSPLADIDPSGQTVVFWHVWGTGKPSEGMTAIVDEFNATNEWGITVEAVDQGRYSNVEDAMNAAIQSGDLPDALVGYPIALANWYAVDVLVDFNLYIDDPILGLTQEEKADFYAAAINAAVMPDGARVGFPISQSGNVLFYNKTWAQDLGFDAAPTTFEEFKEQACAAAAANNADDNPDNDGTGGLVLYVGASNVMSWVFAFGGDVLTQDRTGYAFNTPVVQDVAARLKELWDEGCAFPTESYPNPEFASRQALFTMSSTAGIPYQIAAFEDEGATKDEWGLVPFPGYDQAAVNAFGQNIAIVKTTPEKNLATWLFVKYFTSPEVQATWIRSSAYYPTRASTVALLGDFAAENPQWASGLELLPLGQVEPSLPSWATVRREVQDTFDAIIQGTTDQIPGLLADLDAAAAEAVEETQ